MGVYRTGGGLSTWRARDSPERAVLSQSSPAENLIVRFRDALASFGESPPPGVSLYFGTRHIITGQWVRLGSRFGGDLACFLDPSPRSCHWLRFVIRSSASSEGGELASFGESSPSGVSLYFGTRHIITGQWVRLGSRFGGDLACFLDPSPRSCHWLRFVIRSSASSEGGELASFGESPSPGASLYFGTQHIRTDQWVRLGSRFGGELACFLDPSPRSCHWLRGSCPQDVGPPPQAPPRAGCRNGVASLHPRGNWPSPRPPPGPDPSSGQHLGDMSRLRFVRASNKTPPLTKGGLGA